MSARNRQQLLDSDDELPTTYKEVTYVPAYQDDSRFNDVAISNLTKDCYGTSEDSISDISSSHASEDEIEIATTEKREKYSVLLREGVLSRKDAYCIKVFGTVFDDETLLWFINFTISKDIQSDYSFLIGCLVCDVYAERVNFSNNFDEIQNCDKRYCFEYK